MAVFDETTTSPSNFEELVGEGKKFATPDDLARGKMEADRVIKAREQENEDLRQALADAETRADLALRAAADRPTPQSERQVREPEPAAQAPTLTDEDLAKRIRAINQHETEQERIQRNTSEVAFELIRVYGSEDKANEVVNQKARELGVPVSFLQEVAAKSPKAFYTQLGVDVKPTPTTQAPHSDVNTVVLGNTRTGPKPGTYGYYENLRATEGNAVYFSPKVQNQLMKDAFAASERGEDFYKT